MDDFIVDDDEPLSSASEDDDAFYLRETQRHEQRALEEVEAQLGVHEALHGGRGEVEEEGEDSDAGSEDESDVSDGGSGKVTRDSIDDFSSSK